MGGGGGSSGSGMGDWTNGVPRPGVPPGTPPVDYTTGWNTWADSPDVQSWLSGMPSTGGSGSGTSSSGEPRGGHQKNSGAYSDWLKTMPGLPTGASGKNNKAWTTFFNALLKKGAKPPGPVSAGAMANLKLLYPTTGDPAQWIQSEQNKIKTALGQAV